MSHGMFSFPWPSAARNEQTLPEKAAFMLPKPPVTQIPLFNKLKRKRGDSSPTRPGLNFPELKRRMETTSREQMPALDGPRLALPIQGSNISEGTRSEKDIVQMLQPSLSDCAVASTDLGSQGQSSKGRLASNGSSNQIDHDNDIQTAHTAPVTTHALRETIEAQFGLEILLKHKELRLIDQEFAKCQVALEQLRRCQVIPFPSMTSQPEDMQAASNGLGPVFKSTASYAPPWGITDGPYSRHYQQWLIPDSAFGDVVAENIQLPPLSAKSLPDRATRGSKSEKGTVAGASRSQRGSNGARLKALPHGYPEPKEEKGPMVVKRGSDGKMVKLVCLDCRRSNFNSAQGFINHCRIAHSRQFLSHDAAIEASGEEIDVDADGSVGETSIGSQATASSALVHPLIRSSAHLARISSTEQPPLTTSKRKISQATNVLDKQPPDTISKIRVISTPHQFDLDHHTSDAPFTPSAETPHLSALFSRLGRGGDLAEMVTEAKTRPDPCDIDSSDDEDHEVTEIAAATASAPKSRSTRGVLRGGDTPAFQKSSPPLPDQSPAFHTFSVNARRQPYPSSIGVPQRYPSPYHPNEMHEDHSISINSSSTPFNLSPNTIESHTAPSLVSDDGDYENTHSESESPSPADAEDDEDHYVHARVMDHDDMDLGEGTSTTQHLNLGGKIQTPTARRRSSAIRPPMLVRNAEPEQRHVTFASPVRRPRRESRTTDGK